jgi:hypothetical protein
MDTGRSKSFTSLRQANNRLFNHSVHLSSHEVRDAWQDPGYREPAPAAKSLLRHASDPAASPGTKSEPRRGLFGRGYTTAPLGYRFLKYLAIGSRVKPAFS